MDCISAKTIFHICILTALLCSFAAISMGMENQSQLHNVSMEQSLLEKQASQSQMIHSESQARNPMRGCTRSFSSSNISGATAIICPSNFLDHFNQENSDLWLKSDWENVDPIYLNAWLPDTNHIKIADGNLQLTLDNEPCIDSVSLCHGQDFASGQYYTACDDFRYGNLSARIKAGKGNGVITSMYLFEDGAAAGMQDEIDIEIFGKDAVALGRWEMQTNYLRQGSMGDCWYPYGYPEPCHVGVIPLSFDPTQSYHDYTISWIGEGEICTDIDWYVDDKLRRHVWLDANGYIHSNIFDENGNVIESSNIYQGSLPNRGCRILLGLWAAQNWDLAGQFNYVTPINAKFDWLTATRSTNSAISNSVGLQAANGQYLCAEGGGGDVVLANRNSLLGWETFELIDLGNSNVALKAANGQYVCAEGGGGGIIVANRNSIGAWETFKLIDRGNGYYALQAANGQYVCAEGGGGDGLVANRDLIGSWETFRLLDLRRPARVALQAYNSQYMCAEGGGGDGVVANRNAVLGWETFNLIDLGNGNIALQAANSQYVCAEGGGGNGVVANRDLIAAWETFRLIYRGNGNIALQAANGQYVCAEGGGGDGVVANRDTIGAWETFKLIPI